MSTSKAASIGSNIKSIIKTSINIPLELLSVTVEVVNDATQLTSASIRTVVPTAKALTSATTNFVVGAANSELSEDELKEKVQGITAESLIQAIEDKSGKAGQLASKKVSAFFAD